MATRDIEVTVGDEVFILNFGANAACRFEAAVNDGRSYGELLAVLRRKRPLPPVTLIRHFVAAAIVQPAHVSIEEVGRFIDNVGGWTTIYSWLQADQRGKEPTLPRRSRKTAPNTETAHV